MTSENTVIELGYRGVSTINGTNVLANSGSMENTVSTSYLSGYDMAGTDLKSRIYHAAGTVVHTGSLSFDLTGNAVSTIKNILRNPRATRFTVNMFGNDSGWSMSDCVANSISLSGAPNGLVSGSLSFMSDSPPVNYSASESDLRDTFSAGLVPYWHTGASLVRDWSLNFSMNVAPKFCNGDTAKSYGLYGIKAHSPKYLFLGECQYDLSFSAFKKLTNGFSLKIGGGQIFTCNTYVVQGSGFNVGGANEINIFKYGVTSHALNDNEGIQIS